MPWRQNIAQGASTKRKAEDDGVQELPDEPSNTHSSSSSGSDRPTTTPALVQQQPADEDLEEDPQFKRRRLCTLVKSIALTTPER